MGTSTDGRTFRAQAAVTTLPHSVLTRGGMEFDPALPDAKTAAITRLASGPVAKVILSFEAPFWPARAAQIVCGSGPVTLYRPTSFGTDGPAVLTAYTTGALFWAGSATESTPVAATVEAAYLSGLRAARQASEQLRVTSRSVPRGPSDRRRI